MCVHLKILEYAYEDPEGAEDDKSGKYNTRKHEDRVKQIEGVHQRQDGESE